MGVGAGAAGGPAPWLADLSNGARAAVISEAVTWATDLWCALDWERFPSPPRLGPPDRWWSSGQHRSVALRARVDVAGWIPPPGGGRASSPVLLTVYAGCPGATSRAELGLATLVAVLSNPKGPVPARSVGYWPECGRVVAVPTERTTLERTIDAVAAALTHRGAPNNHEHRGELMKAA